MKYVDVPEYYVPKAADNITSDFHVGAVYGPISPIATSPLSAVVTVSKFTGMYHADERTICAVHSGEWGLDEFANMVRQHADGYRTKFVWCSDERTAKFLGKQVSLRVREVADVLDETHCRLLLEILRNELPNIVIPTALSGPHPAVAAAADVSSYSPTLLNAIRVPTLALAVANVGSRARVRAQKLERFVKPSGGFGVRPVNRFDEIRSIILDEQIDTNRQREQARRLSGAIPANYGRKV